MSLIGLLVAIIIIGLIVYLVQLLPIQQPFKNIALIIVVIICILYLFGFVGGAPVLHLR